MFCQHLDYGPCAIFHIRYSWQYFNVYHHGKILVRKILADLVNHWLFAKIFLANINRHGKIVFVIVIDFLIFTKFFLDNNFYLYGSPKVYSTKLFPCIVLNLLTSINPLTGPKTDCTLITKGRNWPCTHAYV